MCQQRSLIRLTYRYVEGGAVTFSGQDLIKESDYGVVAVIIQYRLGVFGFLPGSEVLANGTLNVGLRPYVHICCGYMVVHVTLKSTRILLCSGSKNMCNKSLDGRVQVLTNAIDRLVRWRSTESNYLGRVSR